MGEEFNGEEREREKREVEWKGRRGEWEKR